MSAIRWGIYGCGRIAGDFCAGLRELPDARIARVAARDHAKAVAFAAQHGATHACSYDELIAADDVDVVYVAVTTAQHRDAVRALLARRRAVLCEKPLTCSAVDSAALIAVAQQQRVFFMEAMWTRFFPQYAEIRQWIADGRIGELRGVQADFSYAAAPPHRGFDRALGGGAILDVGIYPLAMAQWLLGEPTAIHCVGHRHADGCDSRASIVTRHAEDRTASITTAIDSSGRHDLVILGSRGRIEIPQAWYNASAAVLHDSNGRSDTVTAHRLKQPLAYQAEHVMRHLRAGELASPLMPHADSLLIARMMDDCMRALGSAYA